MMCLWASYKKKNETNIFFGILKINEERSQDPDPLVSGTDPDPIEKCQGSPTLVSGYGTFFCITV